MDLSGECDSVYMEVCGARGDDKRCGYFEAGNVDAEVVNTHEVYDEINIDDFVSRRGAELDDYSDVLAAISVKKFCEYHGLELKD